MTKAGERQQCLTEAEVLLLLDAKRHARHRSARGTSPTDARGSRHVAHGARRAARNNAL